MLATALMLNPLFSRSSISITSLCSLTANNTYDNWAVYLADYAMNGDFVFNLISFQNSEWLKNSITRQSFLFGSYKCPFYVHIFLNMTVPFKMRNLRCHAWKTADLFNPNFTKTMNKKINFCGLASPRSTLLCGLTRAKNEEWEFAEGKAFCYDANSFMQHYLVCIQIKRLLAMSTELT